MYGNRILYAPIRSDISIEEERKSGMGMNQVDMQVRLYGRTKVDIIRSAYPENLNAKSNNTTYGNLP